LGQRCQWNIYHNSVAVCYTQFSWGYVKSCSAPCTLRPFGSFRARYYIEGETSDSGSTTGATGRSVEARSLPVVKENVKDVMFYCWYSWPFFCVAIWDCFAESSQLVYINRHASQLWMRRDQKEKGIYNTSLVGC
jgi:hypothetical protein